MVQVYEKETGKRVYKGKSIQYAVAFVESLYNRGKTFCLVVE